MIIKDKAVSRVVGTDSPQIGRLEYNEACALCERDMPNTAQVLRHTTTKNILCVLCLTDIAMIN